MDLSAQTSVHDGDTQWIRQRQSHAGLWTSRTDALSVQFAAASCCSTCGAQRSIAASRIRRLLECSAQWLWRSFSAGKLGLIRGFVAPSGSTEL